MLSAKSKSGLRAAVVAFVSLAIASSGIISSAQAAPAPSMVNLWAVPVTSCIEDGKHQILRIMFLIQDPVNRIRLVLDPGPEQQVLVFDPSGHVLASGAAFDFVQGTTKIIIKIGDYYTVVELFQGKFKVGVDKDELAVGDHKALVQVITPSGVLTDDAMFTLKDCKEGKPDLVAKNLATPHWIKLERDPVYNAYFIQKNQGGSKAGEHMIKLFLSYDDELDPGDDLLAQLTVEQLFAGRSKMFHMTFELPDDAVRGPAFLIVMTDADEEVDEEDEGNNTRVREIMIGRAHP